MKFIMRALILILLVGFFTVDQLIPKPSLAGTITALSELKSDPLPHREASVELKNETVTAIVYDSNTVYRIGDEVLLQQDPQFSDLYSVTDFVRTHSLIKLFILFLIVILVVSNWAGLRALFGLLFSFTVIFKFVLPQIALGSNPLMVALVASLIILLVSYYLTHGIHDKSTIAIIGTFGALALTGIMAIIFSNVSKLTGFGNEDVAFLIGQIPHASL
jgi:uncharacterized membrane protein